MRWTALLGVMIVAAIGSQGRAQPASIDFSYHSPGHLVPPKAGHGREKDRRIYLPGIEFPIRLNSISDPAFPNSQVYGVGGQFGPPGSLCSSKNYKMPWGDTYCEKR